MGKSFVFGKTKVAKTSEEIRENISATSKPEDENKHDETTSVTESSDTQQEDSKPSAPLESKEQTCECADGRLHAAYDAEDTAGSHTEGSGATGNTRVCREKQNVKSKTNLL